MLASLTQSSFGTPWSELTMQDVIPVHFTPFPAGRVLNDRNTFQAINLDNHP